MGRKAQDVPALRQLVLPVLRLPAGAELQLEQAGAGVAAFMEQRQERRPVGQPFSGGQVLIPSAVVVVEMRVDETRQQLPRDPQRVAAAKRGVAGVEDETHGG
jgi:hypothetical protein